MVRGIVRWARPWVRALLAEEPTAQLTSTRRSRERQAELYRDYLAGRGTLAARPGTSDHESGHAFDVRASPAVLRRLGSLWRSVGGGWASNHPIHFVITPELEVYRPRP